MTRAPELAGQTVVVIGGSSGMGLETARRAREEGAEVILTGRNAEHLKQAAAEVGARDTAAFDVTDPAALDRFFADLEGPIDHLYMTAGGPYYAPLAELDFAEALRALDAHLLVPLRIGQHAVGKVRPGGTLLFMSGTGARRPAKGQAIAAIGTAGIPALVANLALELAPVRVNGIAAGFVDTPLSARLLGDDLEARRARAARHAAHPAGGRAGRHRRAGRAPDGQHRGHRGDLRHRRRGATRLGPARAALH